MAVASVAYAAGCTVHTEVYVIPDSKTPHGARAGVYPYDCRTVSLVGLRGWTLLVVYHTGMSPDEGGASRHIRRGGGKTYVMHS